MSSFQLWSDEDMTAVFRRLDFPTNCKLRRCSRRWHHVLRSANVLRTVVFCSSISRLTASQTGLSVYRSTFPHLVNLVMIGQWFPFEFVNKCCRLLDMPVKQVPERRLYLCNFDTSSDLLQALYDWPIFDYIGLSDITLNRELVRHSLIRSLRGLYKVFPRSLRAPDGVHGLRTRLSGHHVFKSPSDVIDLDATGKQHITKRSFDTVFFGQIADNMRHLTHNDTTEMLERLAGLEDQDKVQATFVWLLNVYEPDLNRSTEQLAWRTFDYQRCSPLVGRVLACYSGGRLYGDSGLAIDGQDDHMSYEDDSDDDDDDDTDSDD